MNKNNAKKQLNSLIEHFNNGCMDFNEKDIEAIMCLLEENKKIHQSDTYTNIVHNQFQIEKRNYENILDELEKWLEEEKRLNGDVTMKISEVLVVILKKIKELKGE